MQHTQQFDSRIQLTALSTQLKETKRSVREYDNYRKTKLKTRMEEK